MLTLQGSVRGIAVGCAGVLYPAGSWPDLFSPQLGLPCAVLVRRHPGAFSSIAVEEQRQTASQALCKYCAALP